MKPKYLLDHYIGQQPQSLGIEGIIKILENEHNISRSTFHRDRAIDLSDETSIPLDRMDVYAGLFGVTINDLKNYVSKPIKPLSERKQSQLAKSIIKKTKLTKG